MKKLILSALAVSVFLVALFFFLNSTFQIPHSSFAFTGPQQGGGTGSGAIGVNASNNLSVGTSTPQADTKFLIMASSTGSDGWAMRILQPDSQPLFIVRNDRRIGIGSVATATASYVITLGGDVWMNGNLTFPDGTTQITAAGSATIPAQNVTAGVFGAGNFAFQSSLGIGTSTQMGLPAPLSVYGTSTFSGNVGIGTTGPGADLNLVNDGTTDLDILLSNGTAQGIFEVQSNNVARMGTVTNHSFEFITNNAARFKIVNSGNVVIGSSTAATLFSVATSTNIFNVLSAGNVGIGTSSPAYKLDVAGSVRSATGGFVFPDGTTQTSAASTGLGGGGTLNYVGKFTDTGTIGNSLIFDNGTNVGIGTTVPSSTLHVVGTTTATQFVGGGAGITGVITATNFSGSLVGDVTGTQGATVVGNDSHNHAAATISGLGVADFTSANISQWTNDSVYITDGNTNWDNSYGFITATDATPVGSIMAYGGATAPSGWLLADGTAVSRTTYSALFAILSTTYGVGDGSTTFNLPDLRQRFPLGKAAAGTGSALGGTGGAIDHTHTGPSHTHTFSDTVDSATSAAATHTHTIASEAGHTHTFSGPAHTHSISSEVNHNHTITAAAAHDHSPTGTETGHQHNINVTTGNPSATVGKADGAGTAASGTHKHDITSITASAGTHYHTVPSSGAHDHGAATGNAGAHSHGGNTGSTGDGGGTTGANAAHSHGAATGADGAHTHTLTDYTAAGTTSAGGTGATGSNNPPYVVVNYIVKY